METRNKYALAAIVTKYVPCTNTKPSRIKVMSQRMTKFYSYDTRVNCEDAHIVAVSKYLDDIKAEDLAKYGDDKGWGDISDFSIGGLPEGCGYNFVFVRNS